MLGDCDTWEELDRFGSIMVGSPETVRRRLWDLIEQAQVGNFLIQFHFGNMSDHLVRKSMRLFATEVAPALRRRLRRAVRPRLSAARGRNGWRRAPHEAGPRHRRPEHRGRRDRGRRAAALPARVRRYSRRTAGLAAVPRTPRAGFPCHRAGASRMRRKRRRTIWPRPSTISSSTICRSSMRSV